MIELLTSPRVQAPPPGPPQSQKRDRQPYWAHRFRNITCGAPAVRRPRGERALAPGSAAFTSPPLFACDEGQEGPAPEAFAGIGEVAFSVGYVLARARAAGAAGSPSKMARVPRQEEGLV